MIWRVPPAVLVLGVLLLAAVAITWRPSPLSGPRLNWQTGLKVGDVAAQNVVLTQFLPDGGMDYRATAVQAYHDPSTRKTYLYDLSLIQAQTHPGAARMTARAGEIRDDNRVVDLFRNVKVYMLPDYQVVTERLRYDPATGWMTTDAPVRLTRGQDWMSGVGLRLSVPARTAELRSRVRAYYAP